MFPLLILLGTRFDNPGELMVSSLTAMQPMHDGAFSRYPDQKDFIDLAPEFGTRLTLFIDTEAEFDWHKPFSRTGYTVQSLKGLTEGQGSLTSAGLRPVQMVDYTGLHREAALATIGRATGREKRGQYG